MQLHPAVNGWQNWNSAGSRFSCSGILLHDIFNRCTKIINRYIRHLKRELTSKQQFIRQFIRQLHQTWPIKGRNNSLIIKRASTITSPPWLKPLHWYALYPGVLSATFPLTRRCPFEHVEIGSHTLYGLEQRLPSLILHTSAMKITGIPHYGVIHLWKKVAIWLNGILSRLS